MIDKKKIRILVGMLSLSIAMITIFQLLWLKDVYRKELFRFTDTVVFAFEKALQSVISVNHDVISIENFDELIEKDLGNQQFVFDMILADTMAIGDMNSLMLDDFKMTGKLDLTDSDKIKIDSLFNDYLRASNIDISFDVDYEPEIPSVNTYDSSLVVFFHPLAGRVNLDYANNFFILRKMIGLMLSSLFFTLIMMGSSYFLVKHYLKEKKIFEFKNDFINNLTHELQTPITISSLALEKLNDISVDHKMKKYVSISQKENHKLSAIAKRILLLAELDSPNLKMSSGHFKPNQLIAILVKNFRLQLTNEDTIETLLCPEEVFLNFDESLLNDVLVNILDNALKYSNSPKRIQIKTFVKNEDFFINIKDNGIGIDSQFKEKIFEPFFRISNENVHIARGYGLGLSYVFKIVKLVEGTITVESKLFKGTTFRIKLPL